MIRDFAKTKLGKFRIILLTKDTPILQNHNRKDHYFPEFTECSSPSPLVYRVLFPETTSLLSALPLVQYFTGCFPPSLLYPVEVVWFFFYKNYLVAFWLCPILTKGLHFVLTDTLGVATLAICFLSDS